MMTDPEKKKPEPTPEAGDVPASPAPPTAVPASPWTSPDAADAPEIDVDDILAQKSKRVRKLGEGGHSEVWLVEHLGQLEAHKYLTHDVRAHEAVFREALHTRQVGHPNIVQIFGVEEVDGAAVLRMEYIAGDDLAGLVDKEGILPVERLLPLAIQVADALRATHERGIVHHDLKPSNLLLRDDGKTVIVTDFGVSAALREGPGRGRGTPHFVAPELNTPDGRASAASDVWSFAITLHYLLTLGYPFPFREMEPAEAVKQEPRDPCATHLYVTPELGALLMRMLAADPADRVADMAQVKQELEQLLTRVACPACGRFFDLQGDAERCPHPNCESERFGPFKRGWLERRAAETALAMCQFDEAGKRFKSAGKAFDEAGADDFREDAARRGGAIKDLREELDRLVAAARSEMDQERLIEATRRLQRARSRFSRAAAVRELRGDLREVLTQAHGDVVPRV